jgi:hypothetical protein
MIDQARERYGSDRDVALLEARIASHAGTLDRAGALLARLDERTDAQLARGQHRLQSGRPVEGAQLLEEVVRAEPRNLAAWALLALSWRLTGDPRHDWLCLQPGLYGTSELPLTEAELGALADVLRGLHRSFAQPLGQSVRGGTQTAGKLFMRSEPEIVRLTHALSQAVSAHFAKLPPGDPRHPLLRHRSGRLTFAESWSVRLTGGGFHVAHLHPGGVLSSACYVSLPPGLGAGEPQEGWLELGRPPAELGIDLPPLAQIEPRPGRLALFPSYMFHGTRPFRAGERLTVAFDVAAL